MGRGEGKTAGRVCPQTAAGGTSRNEIPEEMGVTSSGKENVFQGLI